MAMYAHDGTEAITYAKNIDFDLVILDLEMPKMDGFESIPRIKEIIPNAKIIVCSGLTRFEFDTIQRVLGLGVDGVVSKLFQKGTNHELSMDNFRLELVPRIMKIYSQKFIENAQTIVDHSYANNIIDGVLIIHLIEKNRDLFSYDFGEVEVGYQEVNNLIDLARNTNTPICFDDGHDPSINTAFETLHELKNRFEQFPSDLCCKFDEGDTNHSLDWINPSMNEFIVSNKVKNVLVVGFNRTCCVKNSIEQIQKYYKVNAFTCENYLFGNKKERSITGEFCSR
jgi:CheY-like chemotaxis protein